MCADSTRPTCRTLPSVTARRNWPRFSPAPTRRWSGSLRAAASTTRVTETRRTRAQGAVRARASASMAKPGLTPVASTETFFLLARRSRSLKAAARAGTGQASSSQVVSTLIRRDTSAAICGLTSLSSEEVQTKATSARTFLKKRSGLPSTLIRSLRGRPSTAPRSLPACSGAGSAAATSLRAGVCSTARATAWPTGPSPAIATFRVRAILAGLLARPSAPPRSAGPRTPASSR